MPRPLNRLTARHVATLNEPGRHADGGGLYLSISRNGGRRWVFLFARDGRAREMGLGSARDVALAEARAKAAEARRLLRDGQDPIGARDALRHAQRLEDARAMTFRAAAEGYIEAHRPGWRNAKHADQWAKTLELYAYPSIGALPVAAVDVALVLKCIEPIWTVKPETAGRVRGRIELIIDWAAARGYRTGENPARWRGHLDKLLPARSKVRKTRHHPALPYAELPGFMEELRSRADVGALCLEFLVLTAARTGEVIGSKLSEIDLEQRLWVIPGERMKAGREHRVPLCARAIEIIKSIPRDGDFLFPGAKRGSHLSQMAMLMTLRRMGKDGLTVHGFRSTFRDWAAEQTSFPAEVAEMALAHAVGDRVEAAYRRGDLFEKRRRLMEAWAGYADGPARRNVVAIRRGAA